MSVHTNDQPSRTSSAESATDSVARTRDAMVDDVRSAVGTARETAATAAARAPEVATATRGAMTEAMRQMEAGSDQALTTGAAFALGAAMGMLVGGAPRLLVVATLVPVAAAGMILLDRRGPAGRPTR
jgi:VIT1/CCC1 family predicted Fe2+/Mn2+ transporter